LLESFNSLEDKGVAIQVGLRIWGDFLKTRTHLVSGREMVAGIFSTSFRGLLLLSDGALRAQTANFPDANLEAIVDNAPLHCQDERRDHHFLTFAFAGLEFAAEHEHHEFAELEQRHRHDSRRRHDQSVHRQSAHGQPVLPSAQTLKRKGNRS
jgi:hypothetical protein